MHADDQKHGIHCLYSPRIGDCVDVTEQIENGATRYVVRNTATNRYFLIGKAEYAVFRQFDGSQTLSQIAQGGKDASGPRTTPAVLIKFLTKLDSLGLLARGGSGPTETAKKQERGLYIRIHLFNPNRLLEWIDRRFGWALTKPFIAASFVLMALVTFGLLSRADDVATYTSFIYAEYGLVTILITTLTITVLHEFAHGLACKHFGGDVPEVGVLMIYYVLPGLYCNVTDIYRIGRRSERLWVICAGIYWQLTISTVAALLWLVATPYGLLADLSFLVFTGGLLNVLFNCNPLIKLDGYYALSQLLGIQNLQGRSSQYVRSLFGRLLGAQQSTNKTQPSALYIAYWVCSIIYSIALMWLILGWAGGGLMDWLGFAGVLLTLLLAALLTEKWWKPATINLWRTAVSALVKSSALLNKQRGQIPAEGVMNMSAQRALQPAEPQQNAEAEKVESQDTTHKRWLPPRGRVIKAALALLIVALLVAPWEASTGSDCALLLPPGHETVARANTDAVLAEIYVQPGDAVSEGTKIARLSNPEIEDRLTQLNSEIERFSTNASRIEDELRVRSEMLLSASFKEVDRKRMADELKKESGQIASWNGVASQSTLPPALAVLQSEIELKQTELEHNRREVERYKKLFDQGLVGEQQYDRTVAAMRLGEKELQGARARLEAALVDHRRLASGAETNSLIAETEARAARSSFEELIAQLQANRQQLESLRQRRDILRHEYEGMTIVAPRAGVVLGDDLRRSLGRRYGRGEEICRIGELERFLLRIDVSEREISNVRLDSPVRFKLKTVPGRTFTGHVSKINAEPSTNQQGQRFYPVEVLVENSDGLLRPGMTGFARISFGRQSIGLLLADKLWQALRPELWLF